MTATRPDPEPLEGNARVVVAVGTLIWLMAGVVLIPFHRRLNADGHLWWIAAAFVGAGLGLVGLLVVIRRERRLQVVAVANTGDSGNLDRPGPD